MQTPLNVNFEHSELTLELVEQRGFLTTRQISLALDADPYRLEVEELRQRLHVLACIALMAEEPEAVSALKLRGVHLSHSRTASAPMINTSNVGNDIDKKAWYLTGVDMRACHLLILGKLKF